MKNIKTLIPVFEMLGSAVISIALGNLLLDILLYLNILVAL